MNVSFPYYHPMNDTLWTHIWQSQTERRKVGTVFNVLVSPCMGLAMESRNGHVRRLLVADKNQYPVAWWGGVLQYGPRIVRPGCAEWDKLKTNWTVGQEVIKDYLGVA